MNPDALITLIIALVSVVLFATEVISIDLVALLILVSLVVTGVITPEEGIAGFSNTATITVAFMFILSATILKTGALQHLAYRLSNTFRYNYKLGMIMMMLLIAFMSAFVNNTPVVVIFIPVVIQIAHASGQSPSKMLIPLSFASIFGGTCTLVGTSTNMLVSGIAEKAQLAPFGLFEFAGMGLIFLVVGTLYMVTIGHRLLPSRKIINNLEEKFQVGDYITEIELLAAANSVGKRIMDSALVNELQMDIIAVRRKGHLHSLPSGDFVLEAGDFLRVKCDIEKIKSLKSRVKVNLNPSVKIAGDDLTGTQSTLVEMVITSNMDFKGLTLKEIDFRHRFRATPLAVKQRDGLVHNDLYNLELQSGDVILAEVKSHYLPEIKKMERQRQIPFALLSENVVQDYDRKKTFTVLAVIFGALILSALDLMHIMTPTLSAVVLLVLLKTLSMKEAYEAIHWKIVFLIVGSLSLGTAMQNSGLDKILSNSIIGNLGAFGPYAILSGIYLLTSFLTELMSNHATAALVAPIAIATAQAFGISPTPLLMAVMFAASASFMTPVGYHCNTMVYAAGNYKFKDFLKVGAPLNLIFWLIATLMIPLFFPF